MRPEQIQSLTTQEAEAAKAELSRELASVERLLAHGDCYRGKAGRALWQQQNRERKESIRRELRAVEFRLRELGRVQRAGELAANLPVGAMRCVHDAWRLLRTLEKEVDLDEEERHVIQRLGLVVRPLRADGLSPMQCQLRSSGAR